MVKLFAVKDGLKKAYRRCENIQFLKPAAGAAAEVALSVYGVWRPYQGKKFLILIQGRSGSSLLCDLLDSHPEVRCQSELLHGRLKAPLTYLTGMASFQPTSRAWGFKTKINQIEQQPGMRSPRELLEALHKDDWSIFSLSRKNCVHAALSRLVAWRRGNCYHNTGQAAASELGKVYLEPGRVLQAARREREERKQVQELTHGLSSLNLTYENDLLEQEAQQRTCRKIFELLSVDQIPVSSVFHKTSTSSLSDSIINAEEIIRAVQGTEIAKYL
jgi:hypothetical protein